MAFNNTGYSPYQYQDHQGWPPNYVQQPNQVTGQHQNPHQQQVLSSQQPQLQQHEGYGIQPQPQQHHANQPSPRDMNHLLQQYPYRAAQRSEVPYQHKSAQYENGAAYYSPVSQTYNSPTQAYQAYTPQRQYNQFSHAQNQQLPPIPQRQLSYSQPHRYQTASPHMQQGYIPASPQMAAPSFHSPLQSAADQQAFFRPSPDPQVLRTMMSQSPVHQPQIRRTSVPLQHNFGRQMESQSPVVSHHEYRPHPGESIQHTVIRPTVTKAHDQHVNNGKFETKVMPRQSDSPVQMIINKSQSDSIMHNIEAQVDKKSFHGHFSALQSEVKQKPVSYLHSTVEDSKPIPKSESPPPVSKGKGSHTGLGSNNSTSKSISQVKQDSNIRPKPDPEKSITQHIKTEPMEELSRTVTEIDYALLLIDLAEEYFDAAYGISKGNRSAEREKDLDLFCKLIATGLGCLEVVLKQWRSALQPAVEAAVRLRYASILYKETTNTSEAEEVLSKGISQCDKLRLLDFKYNMHHLLARVMFTTNPKAAIRYVNGVIKDAEVQNHIPWIYAFRFLSASLSLQTQSSQESLQALNQLKSILTTAKARGDIAIAATACAIEAMVHINRANNLEAIEQAQTALATVRSAENNPNMSKIPQLIIMAYFVDLMCSLFKAESEIAHKTMTAMHETMDELSKHSGWGTSDEILIPIAEQSAKTLPGACGYGVVVSKKGERAFLKMAWIPKDEIYAIGNMLGASTLMHKASYSKKCEELLNNARAFLKVIEGKRVGISEAKVHQDLSCQLDLLKVFASCRRNAWTNAKSELNSLKVKMAEMDDAAKVTLPAYIIYLEAMIAQGTGDTTTALVLYNNPMLVPAEGNHTTTRRSPAIDDLATLATLNSILIVHQSKHPKHQQMDSLMARLDGLDTTSASANMRGAYYLIRALRSDASTDPATNPILNTKNNLREVLQIARQTENSQFSCISLTFMTDRFFKGQTGDQAHKSATTALNLAKRARNDLWTSVAKALLADCLETRGDSANAHTERNEALQAAMRLPAAMQIAADVDGGRVGGR